MRGVIHGYLVVSCLYRYDELFKSLLKPHCTTEKSRASTEKKIKRWNFFLYFVFSSFSLLFFFVREGKLSENIQRFHIDGDQNIQDLLIQLAPRR